MPKSKRSKFFVRLLPTEEMDWENIKIESNKETLHVRYLQDFIKTKNPNLKGKDSKPRFWSFQTDGIFYGTCQETIYDTVMDEVISSIYKGVNIVILALGQTCSGKSFTMSAIRSIYEHRGIVPRFLSAIFSDFESKTNEWKVNVDVSFIEVSGNTIYDLLSKTPKTSCEIKNINAVRVKDEERALALLFKGESRRRSTDDAPYVGANCATGIVTFQFECQSLIRSNAFINRAKVHFIDLAGIETVGKRSLTSFKNSMDQGAANQAKYDIEQAVVHMGKDYHSDHQIKKTCKLVEYLHASLLRGCILRFIGHIRPTFADLEVTLSTLKFGLKVVKHTPTIPLTYYSEPNAELMFENIKEELNQLKEQMLVEKLLSGSNEVESGNFSEARLKHLKRLASAYLQGWSSEVNVLGNTEHIIILKVFKHLFSKNYADLEYYHKEMKRLSSPETEPRASRSSRHSKKSKEEFELAAKSQRKRSFKDPRRISSKTGALLTIGKVPTVQSTSTVVVPEKEVLTGSSFELKRDNVMFQLQDLLVPDVSDKKIWEDFVSEQRLDPKFLENLADLIKTKKMAYEFVSNEYNETRLNLERNRLALKELAWKRHGKTEMYDRSGQVVVTPEERSAAKLLSTLETTERDMKKQLESKYQAWKEATKDFIQQKLKIAEIFKEYCSTKHHMASIPVVAFETVRAVSESEEETSRKDCLIKYYSFLQKKLFDEEMKKCTRMPVQNK